MNIRIDGRRLWEGDLEETKEGKRKRAGRNRTIEESTTFGRKEDMGGERWDGHCWEGKWNDEWGKVWLRCPRRR